MVSLLFSGNLVTTKKGEKTNDTQYNLQSIFNWVGWSRGCLSPYPRYSLGGVLIDNFEEDAFDNGPVNSNTNYFNSSPGSGSIANSRFVTLAISGGPSDSSGMKLDLSGGNDGVQVNFLDETGGTSSGSFSTLQYNGFFSRSNRWRYRERSRDQSLGDECLSSISNAY